MDDDFNKYVLDFAGHSVEEHQEYRRGVLDSLQREVQGMSAADRLWHCMKRAELCPPDGPEPLVV